MSRKKKNIRIRPNVTQPAKKKRKRKKKGPKTMIHRLAVIASWAILILMIFVAIVYMILYNRVLNMQD